MSADSTPRRSRGKAPKKLKKPRPDFPLGIHQESGFGCKKVRGKVYYFGAVATDPKGTAALEEWLEQKENIHLFGERREKTDGLTVADLANKFLAHKIKSAATTVN